MLSWLSSSSTNRNVNQERYGPRIDSSNSSQEPTLAQNINEGLDSNPNLVDNANQNETSSNTTASESLEQPRPKRSQLPSEKVGAGIMMRTLQPGDAKNFPKKNDTCRIHYEGYILLDPSGNSDEKRKIDSSIDRDESFLFRLHDDQVIKGLDLAVENMSIGQKAEVTIPSLYAYGEKGYLPVVPPSATLVFVIELIEFSKI